MMKMIYVSCHVPENRVWELLRLLETARVGNVETRAIIPVVEERETPRVNGADSRGRPPVTSMVMNYLKIGKEYSVRSVAKELGMKNTSVHTDFGHMIKTGQMERLELGKYVRIKGPPDVETV